MEDLKDFLEILLGLIAVTALLWAYMKLGLFLENLGERLFGPSFHWGRRRAPKVEIQTLFHGNTKDQDQI